MAWLLFVSLAFYGWWDFRYVALLVGSIGFNYLAGAAIAKNRGIKGYILTAAISSNLGLLFWYKYANFFVLSISSLLGANWQSLDIVLPLGISFFTFTQIAFLVDVWKGSVKEYNFVHYALFVTYFPHLIAGPVLHHSDMMPQFRNSVSSRPGLVEITSGLFLFCIGLCKKVIIADGIQPFVAPVFDAPLDAPLALDEAWASSLAYTFQLYFDFSGYSDMAVGLSMMFGIVLPLNFNSPYKATNIIEFWRCWHMTLSKFLRDYLYIPLGGSHKGPFRRYLNLMITMLLGGLWHGANWTFVIWGGLHGVYLVLNHSWNKWRGIDKYPKSQTLGRAITFTAVVIAWVFFRAQDFDSAWRIISAMLGGNGCSIPSVLDFEVLRGFGCSVNQHLLFNDFNKVWVWIGICAVIVWHLPNSNEIALKFNIWMFCSTDVDVRQRRRQWAWMLVGIFFGSIVLLSAIGGSREVSEFIYFNF